jgi:hypothetical protein
VPEEAVSAGLLSLPPAPSPAQERRCAHQQPGTEGSKARFTLPGDSSALSGTRARTRTPVLPPTRRGQGNSNPPFG